MEIIVAILVIVFALGFDFTNGFHDAANAIATSISTRALRPRQALIMAAIMNLIGAMLGTTVAQTIAKDIVGMNDASSSSQLIIVLSALLGAIGWNLFTWWKGMPSSSSHALIGGLVGAGISAHFVNTGVYIKWDKILDKVIEPMVISPIVGFILAFIVMTAIQWIFRKGYPRKVFAGFRIAQIFSSGAIALGHGLQDAQKSMGVVFMASIAVGWSHPDIDIPLWIKLACAIAISLGTSAGGWRIMKTLGSKMIDIDSAKGFSAEIVGAGVLYTTAFAIHAPISTTHTITSAIMGAGATKSFKSVRWDTVLNILKTWLWTLPGSALIACIMFEILRFTIP